MTTPTETNSSSFEQFRSYLYLLAKSHIGSKLPHQVDASDLVQQTLMDAYAKQQQFRGETDAQRAAWLRQILAHNLADALKHQYRAKRDVYRQRSLEAAVHESFHRAESWLAANQSTPSQQIERQEDLLRLADGLEKLPDAQRDAIVLRHLQGLCLRDVAEQLGRTEAAAAGLVYRGLNKLHEWLGPSE